MFCVTAERCYDSNAALSYVVGQTWEKPYQGWMMLDCTCLGEGNGRITCTSRSKKNINTHALLHARVAAADRCCSPTRPLQRPGHQEVLPYRRHMDKEGLKWIHPAVSVLRKCPWRMEVWETQRGQKWDSKSKLFLKFNFATETAKALRWSPQHSQPWLSLFFHSVWWFTATGAVVVTPDRSGQQPEPPIEGTCRTDSGATFNDGQRWFRSQGSKQMICTCLGNGVSCQEWGE